MARYQLMQALLTIVCGLLLVFGGDRASADSREHHPYDARIWYLNVKGASDRYAISRYGADGLPDPIDPVIAPSGTGFDRQHVAWPSAIKMPNREIYVFASGYDGKKWGALGLWVSKDGIHFHARGPVFSASAEEAYGIGPTYVYYSPNRAEHFGMYYLIRGPNGPGRAIGYASSSDGIHWRRHSVAYSITESDKLVGLSLSYACRVSGGKWIMVFPGYYSDGTQASFVAVSDDSPRHFHDRELAMSPDGVGTRIVKADARTNYLIVERSNGIVPGHLYLLEGNSAQTSEPVIVKKVAGSTIFLAAPLLFQHSGQQLDSMARSKVDISYVREDRHGWDGIATLYNPRGDVWAEYTVAVRAPSLRGPWSQSEGRIRFSPWTAESWFSAENPTPLVGDEDCH